jgi:hypothetical protein
MNRLHSERNGSAPPGLSNDERFLNIKRQLHQQLITGMDLGLVQIKVTSRRAASAATISRKRLLGSDFRHQYF